MPLPASLAPRWRITTPFYLALLLLVLSLVVFYVSGWAFFILFRESKEYELNKRLETIGLALRPTIRNQAGFVLTALQSQRLPESPEGWIRWFESLRRIYADRYSLLEQELNLSLKDLGLKEVMLLTPQKQVIVSAPEALRPGASAPLLSADRVAWERAMGGAAQSVPIYIYEGVAHSRAYVPIWKSGASRADSPLAILRVEAGLESLQEIAHLRAQALILSGIVTVLMATVALMLYQLMRRSAKIEQRSAHRDRLEAMGMLVAGVAHEIRNPLGIIRTLAEGMRADYEKEEPSHEILSDILGEVERLNQMVNQYLSFAKPEFSDAEDMAEVAQIIDSAVKMVVKGEGVSRVEVECSGDVGFARIAPTALRQILLNLLLNALEASPPEAVVRVQCEARRGGAQVAIRVIDQGTGIAPRDLRRVFDPFYTTKAAGSGLGLSICRRLIEEAGGTISLDSSPGRGSTIQVVLPAAGR